MVIETNTISSSQYTSPQTLIFLYWKISNIRSVTTPYKVSIIRCLDILYFLVMTEDRYHDARSCFFAKSLCKKQLFRDVTRCLIKQCEISLCAFRREQDGRSSAVATARESQQTCSPHRVIADYVTNTAFTTKGSIGQASWLILCRHLVRQTTGDNFKTTPR